MTKAKLSLAFFVHLCNKLNVLNRGFFSRDEIKQYSTDYYSAWLHGDTYTIGELKKEMSTFSELDYYTSKLS